MVNYLHNRLNSWAEIYNVYIEAQAGFRKNMSTIDNIFVLHGFIDHIKSLYQNLKSRVKSEDNISEEFTCNVGVRQRERVYHRSYLLYI